MRLIVTSLLMVCGCRQLLGLDDLPGASIDAREVRDADPSKLALTHVTPSVILEGTGTQSRPALLVVHGMHVVPGATVEIKVRGGFVVLPVDDTTIRVSSDGTMLAFPLTVPPDPTLTAGARLELDVTVTQQAGTGPVSQTLSELEIAGLDELTGLNVLLPTGVHEFSKVEATSVSVMNPANGPVIIRSRSTVTLGGTSSVSANGQAAGPGGGNGGAGGLMLGAPGEVGVGSGGGQPSGGGGSYGTKGGGMSPNPVGDPALASLDSPNRGSGGAGGNGGPGGAGGAGGGGGGTIEITANGLVVLGTVTARGGTGVPGQADDGGGGSGGTILLRSGVSVTAAVVDASGGSGMFGGGAGRIRIDAPGTVPVTTPQFYRGPTLAAETPTIATTAQPMLSARGQPLTTFRYYFTSADQIRGPFVATFGSGGEATFEPEEPLFEGLNTVCLVVEGGDLERAEARNCIDVVYLF
jgi:hypothetical protein